jgi:hypothetical protein
MPFVDSAHRGRGRRLVRRVAPALARTGGLEAHPAVFPKIGVETRLAAISRANASAYCVILWFIAIVRNKFYIAFVEQMCYDVAMWGDLPCQ